MNALLIACSTALHALRTVRGEMSSADRFSKFVRGYRPRTALESAMIKTWKESGWKARRFPGDIVHDFTLIQLKWGQSLRENSSLLWAVYDTGSCLFLAKDLEQNLSALIGQKGLKIYTVSAEGLAELKIEGGHHG